MFKPFSSFSILFIDCGTIKEWAMGPSGWLRALSSEEKRASERRMVDARTPRLLERSMDADRIWICGCEPSGIPIGVVGCAMRLPEHAEYACNGWLDPDGRFFPCGRGEHENLADALSGRGSMGLDDLGWARIADGAPLKVERHITIGQSGWLRRSGPVKLSMGSIV